MKVITPETKVGLFTIAAGIALLYMSLKTAGIPLFGADEFMTFNMKFTSVAGVELRSKVKLSGVEIGYIEDIVLEDGYASVHARLTRMAGIRKNALATIRTSGLLGEQYIEIVQGTSDQPFIKSGDTIEHTQEAANISDMFSKMGAALDDVSAVTRSLKNVFGTLEGEQTLKNIVGNIEKATENLSVFLAENKNTFRATLVNLSRIAEAFAKNAPVMAENLEKIAEGLRQAIDKNKDNLTTGIANMKDLTEEFKMILQENRGNLRTTLENVATASAKIDDVMVSVKNMSSSIASVAGKIERGEGTIGKLVTDDAVYENLNQTLEGAGAYLGRVHDLNLWLALRGERQLALDETKSFISLKIQPREDTHYLLEVTEDVREDSGDATNPLRSPLFTILFAKRFSDITLKAGLIESSAGAALDYHLFGDRFMVSAEFFNLGGYDANADNVQLKAQLRWNAHKYIYLYLGGDELLNDFYRTFLVGGGIMFDVNDLKLAAGLL